MTGAPATRTSRATGGLARLDPGRNRLDDMQILVDTSPDMREQLLAADVGHVDAVIWTHDHADHCHGIDDLLEQIYTM